MAVRAQLLRTVIRGYLGVGCVALCFGLAMISLIRLVSRPSTTEPDHAYGVAVWHNDGALMAAGTVTVTAPSREAVHTVVNHGLGQVPVAIVLGIDLQEFEYYESIDSRAESGGPPTEVPVHLSAMVRKPYNGTFTIRLKHFAGSRRTFSVRWLAIALERPPAPSAAAQGSTAGHLRGQSQDAPPDPFP
ncbi:MAG: hypothetical protein NUW12_01310 [Firmicutes bacterium]|nr:hypothetical protein [Bacillota bacterium]MDH7494585.1 hypothetical protein [Bacillota bacterium]